MEVKSGFKQTEIGDLPTDWAVAPFGELALIERGKFSARPRNDPRFYGGDIPFLQTGDVTRSGGVVENYSQTLNSDGLRVSRLFPKGTLLFTIAANIGDVGITAFDAACPDSLVAVSPRPSVDKRWLFYELASRKSDFENLASPGAQLNINLEKLVPYLLPVPPREEQRRVGKVLSDLDVLLTGLDRLIAKKRNLKQAAMQELLTGQTRLPGFGGEWQVCRLDELGACFSGGTPSTKRPDYWGGDVFWLPSGRVQNNALDAPSDSEITITQRGLTESAAKLVKPFSVLVAITGATCANVALLQFGAAANQSVVAIEPFDQVDARFIFYALLMERGQILSRRGGSAQGGVNLKAVKGIEIQCPRHDEQTAIAIVLSDMDAELTALEARRDKTRALKHGMMQELLTGRTRLV
jgi:type I restriction enzyme, S subunit